MKPQLKAPYSKILQSLVDNGTKLSEEIVAHILEAQADDINWFFISGEPPSAIDKAETAAVISSDMNRLWKTFTSCGAVFQVEQMVTSIEETLDVVREQPAENERLAAYAEGVITALETMLSTLSEQKRSIIGEAIESGIMQESFEE